MESEVQQLSQERRRKIQEINDTVERSKADADREIANGVLVLPCSDELHWKSGEMISTKQ
ncbi:hypothetical protein N1851_022454 [Merluccius polli]|uniref:Uncharacterized protein n=1 Tax=Merluccius polli TaxID=89951 RepID=A0AA47MHV1_MERPO|nr:hypothetical protein N1851_022454 [Merluccius polli]